MEAEGKVWDPVKLAKHPNPTSVIYYWFHLHHLSFNNYVSYRYSQFSLGNRVAAFSGKDC